MEGIEHSKLINLLQIYHIGSCSINKIRTKWLENRQIPNMLCLDSSGSNHCQNCEFKDTEFFYFNFNEDDEDALDGLLS